MLEFNTAFEKDILVIELEGSLDSHSAADFRGWFNEKIGAGYRAFAIDCLCLEYISSAGITALIELQSLLQNQSGKMVLYQISGETRQLLRFLQLETKLHLAGDYDDAITALTGIQKVVKETAPAMVDVGEMRVIPDKAEASSEAAAAPAHEPNVMVMEENFSESKKGLHPLQGETATAPAPAKPEPKMTPVAAPVVNPQTTEKVSSEAGNPPEAKEIKINTAGAKRLITCPNCKSVLRVAVSGEYLCPACRFRFAYKPAAS